MSTRGIALKGDRMKCPKCHRRVGYWPDKLNYHVAHLMRHRVSDAGLYGAAVGEWCEGTEFIG